MKKGTIITIGRSYGSAGREIGLKLADRLGIAFYDKELLRLAAENSGLSAESVEMYDEVPTNSLLYSLSLGNYGMAMGSYDVPIHQKIFMAQFDAIQKLADQGESCVIIGRCADYALAKREQIINIFVKAQPDARVARLTRIHPELTPKKAAEAMVKRDKKRANYHNFYADTRWGTAEAYDLVIDGLQMGIDNAVDLLQTYCEMRFPGE